MDAVRNIMERLASEGPQYTRQLASSIGVSSEYVRKLCRCLRHHKLIHSEGGMHGITEAGRARLADRYLPCQRKGRAATSEGRPCGSGPGILCGCATISAWTIC